MGGTARKKGGKKKDGNLLTRLFRRSSSASSSKERNSASRSRKQSKGSARDMNMKDDGTQAENSSRKIKKNKRKRIVKSVEAANEGTIGEDTVGEPAGKQIMREFVLATCVLGVKGILDEFNEIKMQTQSIEGKSKTAFDSHPDKNRYKDVYCIDADRVILSYPPGATSDYIHANWTAVADGRKHICTQGPTANTVDDFWRMIWQEKCKAIVMLCNVIEAGKKKCEQYYPVADGSEMTCGTLTIKAMSRSEVVTVLMLTELTVTDGKETLNVDHIQWVNWPDRGVPKETTLCYQLMKRIQTVSPVVIHCSAGIGRTGTIVGLDMLYARFRKGDSVRLKDIVLELRSHRHGSVQTDIQYLYMHKVIVDIALERNLVTPEEVRDFNAKYEEKCRMIV